MLTWHYVTRAQYDAASAEDKSTDKLFYLSDTKEIYRGTESFSESCILYTDEPTVKAVGKLYINSTTLEGRIWNGSAWTTVIQPVQSTVSASNTNKPVSGKAVSDYVATEINKVNTSADIVKSVAYTAATNNLVVTMANNSTSNIPMTNVAADLSYDKATGKLQVKNASGTIIGTGINLDLERFVSAASYNHDTRTITLSFNDNSDPLEIEIGDLVDVYTAANSTTVSMTVTGNQFTAEAIVASDTTHADNLLKKTANGLYVAPVDLSGKVDKVTAATAGDIAVFVAGGNISDSNVKVGGSTLASAPTASVLATEAAVNAVKTALQNNINKKMDMVGSGHEKEIIVANSTGNASASGVKVGNATLAASPNATTVATEAAVKTYVTGYAVPKTDVVTSAAMSTTVANASDTKVASEKAVVNALTWITTV